MHFISIIQICKRWFLIFHHVKLPWYFFFSGNRFVSETILAARLSSWTKSRVRPRQFGPIKSRCGTRWTNTAGLEIHHKSKCIMIRIYLLEKGRTFSIVMVCWLEVSFFLDFPTRFKNKIYTLRNGKLSDLQMISSNFFCLAATKGASWRATLSEKPDG